MTIQAERKSLSDLEREAEHTRADLVHAVDELHSRVSPNAIKEEMKAYARDTGNELMHTLTRKARQNPLPTVAVAAGLGYAVWRFLINIPAPILLVGAGLALTQFGSSSRARTSDRDGEQFADSLKRTVQDASSNLSHAAEGLKEKILESAEQARVDVSSGLEAVRSRAAAAISDTTDSARAAASDTMTAATDAVTTTYRSGMDVASRTGDQLS